MKILILWRTTTRWTQSNYLTILPIESRGLRSYKNLLVGCENSYTVVEFQIVNILK